MTQFAEVSTALENVLNEVAPLLEAIDDAVATQARAPGKWSRKQILCHLLDSAENNHQRFVRAAIHGELQFPGYEQDALVDLQKPNLLEWDFLVQFWMNYNRFIAHVLRQLPDERWDAPCTIGTQPARSLGWLAQDYVEHLKHHLNQIVGERFATTYGKGS